MYISVLISALVATRKRTVDRFKGAICGVKDRIQNHMSNHPSKL